MREHLQEVHGCVEQNGCYAREEKEEENGLLIQGEEGIVRDVEEKEVKKRNKTPEEWRAWMKANP